MAACNCNPLNPQQMPRMPHLQHQPRPQQSERQPQPWDNQFFTLLNYPKLHQRFGPIQSSKKKLQQCLSLSSPPRTSESPPLSDVSDQDRSPTKRQVGKSSCTACQRSKKKCVVQRHPDSMSGSCSRCLESDKPCEWSPDTRTNNGAGESLKAATNFVKDEIYSYLYLIWTQTRRSDSTAGRPETDLDILQTFGSASDAVTKIKTLRVISEQPQMPAHYSVVPLSITKAETLLANLEKDKVEKPKNELGTHRRKLRDESMQLFIILRRLYEQARTKTLCLEPGKTFELHVVKEMRESDHAHLPWARLTVEVPEDQYLHLLCSDAGRFTAVTSAMQNMLQSRKLFLQVSRDLESSLPEDFVEEFKRSYTTLIADVGKTKTKTTAEV